MDAMNAQLRVGGYVLPGAQISEDIPVDTLDARTFSHAGLPSREVVRLTPSTLAQGEDAAMETLGFSLQDVQGELAVVRQRSLGFPSWVLVNMPSDAAEALSVARVFRRNARQALIKPGAAKSAFDAQIAEVSEFKPHFLPTLCEEMGRVFLASGNSSHAAMFFGKAREVEQKFGLDVDEERRRSVFLEFTLAGAVSAKAMTEYSKDLAHRHGDKEAYDSWADLLVRRTLGGNPLTPSMFKDLKRLAKSAGLKPKDAEDEVLGKIWHSSSLVRAAASVWVAIGPALSRLSKTEADLPNHLLNLFPHALRSEDSFGQFWFELLHDVGAIAKLKTRKSGGIANWFSTFISACRTTSWDDRKCFPEAGFPVLTECAEILVADQVSVVIGGDEWCDDADLDLLDHLLELGIPVDAGTAKFEMMHWMNAPADSEVYQRSLDFVSDHPIFGPRLDLAVGAKIADQDFLAAAQGKAGLTRSRKRWLRRRLDDLSSGSVAAFGKAVKDLTAATDGSTFLEFPDLWESIQKLDLAAPFYATLKRGFLGEFDWPTARKAAEELGLGKGVAVEVAGVFPNSVFYNEERALVVNGESVILDHAIALTEDDEIQGMRFVGGQLLITFMDDDYDRLGYWSGTPEHRFDAGALNCNPSWSVYRDDGSVVEGARAFQVGEESPPSISAFWSDGKTFWRRAGNDSTMYEFDPDTGELGRASLPKAIEDHLEEGWELQTKLSCVYPTPDSSLQGTYEGVYFKAVFKKEDEYLTKTPLGVVSGSVPSLLPLRGGELAVLAKFYELHQPDGTVLDALMPIPTVYLSPASFAHFSVVDEAASLKLRKIEKNQAAAVLAHAIQASENATVFRETWAAGVPDVTPHGIQAVIGESELVRGVERVADSYLQHLTQFATHIAESNPSVAVSFKGPICDPNVWGNFECVTSDGEYSFDNVLYGGAERDLNVAIGSLVEFFKEGIKPDVSDDYSFDFSWAFRFPKVLSWVAVAPWISDSRQELVECIDAVADSGLFELADNMTMFKTSQASWVQHGVKPRTGTFFIEFESTRIYGYCGRYECKVYSILAYSTDNMTLPAGVTATDLMEGVPWSSGTAKEFVKLFGEHGPALASREAAQTIAEATGLSVAEAAMVWAMFPNIHASTGPIMEAELRNEFELKAAELKAARESLRDVPGEKRCAVLMDAFPEDVEDFWNAPLEVARGLAEAWNKHVGKRVAIPDDVAQAMQKDLPLDNPRAALLRFYTPTFTVGGTVAHETEERLFFEMKDGVPSPDALVESLHVLPYLFYTLPVGHPTRQKISKYYSELKKVIFDSDFLLPTSTQFDHVGYPSAVTARLGRLGADQTFNGVTYFDDGFLVLVPAQWGLAAAIRPAQLLAGKTSEHIVPKNREAVALQVFVQMDGLVERAEKSAIPDGGYEANPLHSAPETVAQVQKELDVSEDSAIAFLQTLAMPNPSTKQVRQWNGWSASAYKKAFEPLVEKGLLIDAKRARTGRTFFLDGPWLEFKSPHFPMEAWKESLMPQMAADVCQVNYPVSAPHELFEQAWTRWSSGDKPGFTK